MKKKHIEEIKDEVNDSYSNDDLYNINSWGADLSFRELISMYDENELLKPELFKSSIRENFRRSISTWKLSISLLLLWLKGRFWLLKELTELAEFT